MIVVVVVDCSSLGASESLVLKLASIADSEHFVIGHQKLLISILSCPQLPKDHNGLNCSTQ